MLAEELSQIILSEASFYIIGMMISYLFMRTVMRTFRTFYDADLRNAGDDTMSACVGCPLAEISDDHGTCPIRR